MRAFLGNGRAANDPEHGTASNQAEDGDSNPRGLAEVAFDLLTMPFNAILRRSGDNGDGGMFGASAPNMEISRLSLQYSSANMSEEESSSLINILDRKRYHERLAATRSADDNPLQPRYVFALSKIQTAHVL